MRQVTREQTRGRSGATYRRPARLRAAARSLSARVEALAAPFRDRPAEPVAYDGSDQAVRRRLVSCALMGFIGSLAIFWGASQQSSPFSETSEPVSVPAWFFGLRPAPVVPGLKVPPDRGFYLALVAFYCGMVLLMRAWLRLGRLAREHPGIPVRLYGYVMAAWTVPMLFVAPMLSKDAYSYVAQGEMMSRHISPYVYGPAVLGTGGNSYTILSDKLWWYTTSPYGPVFLWLAGLIQTVVGHSELGGLVLFRLEALFGVGLLAVFVPRLARSFKRDEATAFAYAVMNPIVLIHLIGGMHNDALMLGLLVAGIALARERHPLLGVVLVTLGALVKVPAIVGVIYIGWNWQGEEADRPARLRRVLGAGAISLAVMAAVTEAVGIGWGWVGALTNPDTIRSYLDPMTALGLGAGKVLSALGLGDHSDLMLSLFRGAGAAGAVVIGIVLLWRSRGGASSLRALGLTMLAVVVLGPVMQPWYLAWGVVLLGPVAEGRLRTAIIWLTVVVTFLGVGDASYFVTELGTANPVVFGLASAGALALVLWPFVPRLRGGLAALRGDGSLGSSRLGEEAGLGL